MVPGKWHNDDCARATDRQSLSRCRELTIAKLRSEIVKLKAEHVRSQLLIGLEKGRVAKLTLERDRALENNRNLVLQNVGQGKDRDGIRAERDALLARPCYSCGAHAAEAKLCRLRRATGDDNAG